MVFGRERDLALENCFVFWSFERLLKVRYLLLMRLGGNMEHAGIAHNCWTTIRTLHIVRAPPFVHSHFLAGKHNKCDRTIKKIGGDDRWGSDEI